MKHIQRQQFSFMMTSIKVSLKILVYVFHFVSRLPGVCFFKDELEAATKYSLERFLSICGDKMSKGFLKLHKLIIKPDTRSDHCLKSYN